MNQQLFKVIGSLVKDLSMGKFIEIESDGRSGRLNSAEIKTALCDYGRTLIPLPDQAASLIEIYPNKQNVNEQFVDVPLWTLEEGRSDLTLSLIISKDKEGYHVKINDLHVM